MKRFLKISWIVIGCISLFLAIWGENIFLPIALFIWFWPATLPLLGLTIIEIVIVINEKIKAGMKESRKKRTNVYKNTTVSRPYQPYQPACQVSTADDAAAAANTADRTDAVQAAANTAIDQVDTVHTAAVRPEYETVPTVRTEESHASSEVPLIKIRSLQQVTCINCGSKEFKEKNGRYICRYCGSLYI